MFAQFGSRSIRLSSLGVAFIGAVTFAMNGCGSGDGALDCKAVAVDQKASFMARVDGFPLEVVVDDSFNEGEREGISGAVDEWNRYGKQIRGDGIFRISFDSIPDNVRRANPKDCGASFGYERKFYILKETSRKHWHSIGFDETIPGATLRCVDGDTVLQQIIYIKPDIIELSQVKSVLLHELGHSIGLDHSCSNEDGHGDFLSCAKVGPGHPYRSAVMYPTIRTVGAGNQRSFDSVEVKDELQANDKERAGCLYNRQ